MYIRNIFNWPVWWILRKKIWYVLTSNLVKFSVIPALYWLTLGFIFSTNFLPSSTNCVHNEYVLHNKWWFSFWADSSTGRSAMCFKQSLIIRGGSLLIISNVMRIIQKSTFNWTCEQSVQVFCIDSSVGPACKGESGDALRALNFQLYALLLQ